MSSDSSSLSLAAQQQASTALLRSEASLIEEKNVASALLVEAAAEDASASALRDVRSYRLQMLNARAMCDIAANAKIAISGKEGDRVAAMLIQTPSVVDKKRS